MIAAQDHTTDIAHIIWYHKGEEIPQAWQLFVVQNVPTIY